MKKLAIATFIAFMTVSIFAGNKNLISKETYSSEIKNLDIDLHSENVTIKEIYGNEITLEIYCNNSRNKPEVYVSKGTLSIVASRRSFRIGEYCNIEICIPQDFKFKNIHISTTSGDTNIEKLYAQNILIESSSGNLEADSLTAEYKIDLKKSSGDMKVDLLASDELKVNSSSGGIKIEKINTIDTSISSTSGSIKINKLDTESFDIKTTSGSVHISEISADYFNTESTSGSINLELANVPVATSSISATSGSVKLYVLSKEGFNVEGSTSSGSFNDGINGDRFSPHGSFTKKFFGGGSDIRIKTTSGNISIDD